MIRPKRRMPSLLSVGKKNPHFDSGPAPEYVPRGLGIILKILFGRRFENKDPALSLGNFIGGMGVGKSTIGLILALLALIIEKFSKSFTIHNTVIVSGKNLNWIFNRIHLIFKERAERGLPPIRNVIIILEDAREHHGGLESTGRESRKAMFRLAKIRHLIGDWQDEVGWTRGGLIVVMGNSQSRTSMNLFFRDNAHLTFYHSFSMDPGTQSTTEKDLEGHGTVLRYLKRLTLARLLGDIGTNSEAIAKIQSKDLVRINLRKIFQMIERAGLFARQEWLGRIYHYVDEDPGGDDQEDELLDLADEISRDEGWGLSDSQVRLRLRKMTGERPLNLTRGDLTVICECYRGMRDYIAQAEKEGLGQEEDESLVPEGLAHLDPIDLMRVQRIQWGFENGLIRISEHNDDSDEGIRTKKLLLRLDKKRELWVGTNKMSGWLADFALEVAQFTGYVPVKGFDVSKGKIVIWRFFKVVESAAPIHQGTGIAIPVPSAVEV